jgi:uncharacterized protein YuzE
MQYLKTTDANYLEVNEENNMGELEDKLFISYRGILYTLRDKKIFNIIERKPEDNSGIQSLESMVKNIVGEDATIGNNIKGMFANEDRGELSIAKLIKRGEGQVEAFEAYDFCYIDLDEDAINVASIDIHRESWLNYGESKQYDFDWSLNSSLSNTLGNVSYTRIVKSLRDEISMQVLFSKNQGNTINPESLATIRETSIYTNELPSRIESNNEAKIKKMKSLNFPRVMDDIFAKDLKEAKAKRVIYAVLCLVVFSSFRGSIWRCSAGLHCLYVSIKHRVRILRVKLSFKGE